MKRELLSAFICLFTVFGFSQNWTNYSETNSGLSDNVISSIAIDNNNVAWISATNGCAFQHGLNKFDGTNWTHYSTANSGLVSNAVTRVVTDQNNTVWITYACEGYGITKFDGTTWTTYNTSNSNIPSNGVKDLFVDNNNSLWLLCNGITKFTGTSFINYMVNPNPSQGHYFNTLYVKNNIVYAVGNGVGLIKYNTTNNTFTQYTTTNSNIPGDFFSTLAMDQNGKLWMGGYWSWKGVATFDGTTFTGTNPFSSMYTWVYYNQSIAVDQSNNVWVSTRSQGLYKFDGISWTPVAANLPQDGCAGFVYADQSNRIWYGEVFSGIWTNTPFLGVNEHSSTENITLFPNPVNSVLTITGVNPTTIKVFNVLGQMQLEKSYDIVTDGKIELDVSALSSGVYFINLSGEVKKFIKE